MIDRVLVTLMALSLIVWVGGAITGQIWMFRAELRRELELRATFIPLINWIIRAVYIPIAATAFTCGMLLVWRLGLPFTVPWTLFPIGVFLGTIVVGSVYSLPEYGRLVALLHTVGPRDSALQRRITVAAWVNRVELLLVLMSLVGIMLQVPIASGH